MLLYKNIAPGQGRQCLWVKILIPTERLYHFDHLLQVSKQSLSTLILYIFLNYFIHVYSPRERADKPLESKFWCHSTERPYHFDHLLQVLKKSLWSLILYIFFNVFMHVYSPRPGADNLLVTKSTESPDHFHHLLQVSKWSLWILILYTVFNYFIHV